MVFFEEYFQKYKVKLGFYPEKSKKNFNNSEIDLQKAKRLLEYWYWQVCVIDPKDEMGKNDVYLKYPELPDGSLEEDMSKFDFSGKTREELINILNDLENKIKNPETQSNNQSVCYRTILSKVKYELKNRLRPKEAKKLEKSLKETTDLEYVVLEKIENAKENVLNEISKTTLTKCLESISTSKDSIEEEKNELNSLLSLGGDDRETRKRIKSDINLIDKRLQSLKKVEKELKKNLEKLKNKPTPFLEPQRILNNISIPTKVLKMKRNKTNKQKPSVDLY